MVFDPVMTSGLEAARNAAPLRPSSSSAISASITCEFAGSTDAADASTAAGVILFFIGCKSLGWMKEAIDCIKLPVCIFYFGFVYIKAICMFYMVVNTLTKILQRVHQHPTVVSGHGTIYSICSLLL